MLFKDIYWFTFYRTVLYDCILSICSIKDDDDLNSLNSTQVYLKTVAERLKDIQ